MLLITIFLVILLVYEYSVIYLYLFRKFDEALYVLVLFFTHIFFYLFLPLCVSVCRTTSLSLFLILCIDVCLSIYFFVGLSFCRCSMDSFSLFVTWSLQQLFSLWRGNSLDVSVSVMYDLWIHGMYFARGIAVIGMCRISGLLLFSGILPYTSSLVPAGRIFAVGYPSYGRIRYILYFARNPSG